MKKKAFTLIELLIVVAIIAILAAIAVPNFLEAQVRSKVSRCFADMRSIVTAIESYRVDYNRYPPTRLPFVMTTPRAYITSIPASPFPERPWSPVEPEDAPIYLYVSWWPLGDYGDTGPLYGNNPYDINRDYLIYTGNAGDIITDINEVAPPLRWELKSVGPNRIDDREQFNLQARIYDPTNGTISMGDIVIFNNNKASLD